MVKVYVGGVARDKNGNYILVLREPTTGNELPIWIGEYEAMAIDMELRRLKPQRPLTHDLLAEILRTLNIKMECAIITELRGDTYYALLLLQWGDDVYEIDSRPSDAVAIALRMGAPIYLSEELAKMLGMLPAKRDPQTERFLRLVGDVELPDW